MSEEKLEFTRRLIILGNLALIAWVFVAFFSVLFFTIIYSWLYLILDAVVIYVILRRLGCSSCYRCKACTSGFGRLAGAFFGRGFMKKESVGNRIGLVGFVYFLLLPLPVALLALSMLQVFTVVKVVALICLLALGAYSLSTWYTRSTVQS
ncbi:MAG: hypothetical protein ABSE15_08735 [Candidatus Bathyarchaeia archaeon]